MTDAALNPARSIGAPDAREYSGPTLRLSHVYLRPIAQADYAYLHALELSNELLFRWRLRGITASPEQWVQTLWADSLAQFLVVGTRTNKPIGHVAVYHANFQDGFAYLSAARLEPGQRSPLMVMGVALFLDYVFTCWSFRKLYLELPEFNVSQFESGLGRLLAPEGRLREHFYFNGRYWDQITLALYRQAWEDNRDRFRLVAS